MRSSQMFTSILPASSPNPGRQGCGWGGSLHPQIGNFNAFVSCSILTIAASPVIRAHLQQVERPLQVRQRRRRWTCAGSTAGTPPASGRRRPHRHGHISLRHHRRVSSTSSEQRNDRLALRVDEHLRRDRSCSHCPSDRIRATNFAVVFACSTFGISTCTLVPSTATATRSPSVCGETSSLIRSAIAAAVSMFAVFGCSTSVNSLVDRIRQHALRSAPRRPGMIPRVGVCVIIQHQVQNASPTRSIIFTIRLRRHQRNDEQPPTLQALRPANGGHFDIQTSPLPALLPAGICIVTEHDRHIVPHSSHPAAICTGSSKCFIISINGCIAGR